jgi:DNA-binding PadR family transcriptional regulator
MGHPVQRRVKFLQLKEIRRSLIRLHILIAATKQPLDNAVVWRLLHDCGFDLSLGSVRTILRQFERQRYLISATSVRNGRSINVYTITAAGRVRAREARKKVGNLIKMFRWGELCK